MAEQKERFEAKILNSVAELDFDFALDNVDLEEDAWAYGAPPPADVYKFKWYLDKDGLQVMREKADDPKTSYIRINILGKLVENEEWDGVTVYHTLDSRVFRGKSISGMIGFLIKAGAKKYLEGKQLTAKYVADVTMKLLTKEPTVRAELDWKGSYKYTSKASRNKGEEVWANKYNHWSEFPDNSEKKGEKLHVVTVTGVDGEPHEIRAMTKINRFLGKDEVAPTKKADTPAPSKLAVPLVDLEEDTPAPVAVSQVKPQGVVSTPVGVSAPNMEVSDAELEMMLDS